MGWVEFNGHRWRLVTASLPLSLLGGVRSDRKALGRDAFAVFDYDDSPNRGSHRRRATAGSTRRARREVRELTRRPIPKGRLAAGLTVTIALGVAAAFGASLAALLEEPAVLAATVVAFVIWRGRGTMRRRPMGQETDAAAEQRVGAALAALERRQADDDGPREHPSTR